MLPSHPRRIGFLCVQAFLLILIQCAVAVAVGSEVDPTFSPIPSKAQAADSPGQVALQPDGKIIIYGDFQVVNGVVRETFARLNADGSLDPTFSFNPASVGMYASKVIVQPDGKILVGGGSGSGAGRMVRLNSDGSVDGSFTNPYTNGGVQSSYTVRPFAVQPDGKIYVVVNVGGFHTANTHLSRIHPNGSVDGTFTPINFEGWIAKQTLNDVVLLPNGQLFIAGRHTFGYVFRVNTDGSKDPAFESPVLTHSQFMVSPNASSVAVQADGKILFGGTFETVNGLTRTGLTRLNTDGSVDLQFQPPTPYNGTVRVLSTGKLLVFGSGFGRLNSDGTLDPTFTFPGIVSLKSWAIDSAERIVVYGDVIVDSVIVRRYARYNSDGSRDTSFNPSVRSGGSVVAVVRQSDNKLIVAGDFNQMNGVTQNGVARLNSDGTLDAGFNVSYPFCFNQVAVAVLGDGKVLVADDNNFCGGQAKLVRLNADGSLDAAFNPTLDYSVRAIAVQTDGKILIGGYFNTVNGATQKYLARLNSDGTLDATFTTLLGNGPIQSIVIQSDGKIMIGGSFNGVSGFARTNIARLNADGSVDSSFNAGTIASIYQILTYPDGKYLISTSGTVKRLNANGTTDGSFTSPVISMSEPGAVINSILLQTDGSVVMGGFFTSVNGVLRKNLVRLSANGTLDVRFLPSGTNDEVTSLTAQPGEKVVVGGFFTMVENVVRLGIARINTSPFVPFVRAVNFDYDGDGKADISVYRPSTNYWYLARSSDSQVTYHYFGAAGDIPTPGDFDGDGKVDLAIFRPTTGDWWYQSSVTGVFTFAHFGASGDIPCPSDFDGDGRTDFIIYRPVENNWYRLSSGTGQWSQRYFGAAGDKPVIGDFDGDGKSDPAIFRPATATFWYMSSIDSVHRAIPWGVGSDIPTPADYDGDGKTDAAVYRPSNGLWYIRFSTNGSFNAAYFGLSEDRPVPADYDGDGKADIAVYRPSIGTWYLLRSTAGFHAQQFGNSTDFPTPNMFIP
jgi:uncharacterized delta-60 repeat protein